MHDFQLLLFCVEPAFASSALAAGVHGIIIDWELRGKHRRQQGADTQINQHTLDDLRHMRAAVRAPIIVRINEPGEHTQRELEQAIDGGADEVLLPMVATPRQVERLLDMAQSRIEVGILVETITAVENAPTLGRLPLRRVYVGLNDLAIQRRSASIFEPMIDGTLDRVRSAFQCPFGVAGLTLPELGCPVPCRLLIGELARIDAGFTFLRRSFLADIAGREVDREIPRIERAISLAQRRSVYEIEADRAALIDAILRATGSGPSAVLAPLQSAIIPR